jgi:hypothetical protein
MEGYAPERAANLGARMRERRYQPPPGRSGHIPQTPPEHSARGVCPPPTIHSDKQWDACSWHASMKRCAKTAHPDSAPNDHVRRPCNPGKKCGTGLNGVSTSPYQGTAILHVDASFKNPYDMPEPHRLPAGWRGRTAYRHVVHKSCYIPI